MISSQDHRLRGSLLRGMLYCSVAAAIGALVIAITFSGDVGKPNLRIPGHVRTIVEANNLEQAAPVRVEVASTAPDTEGNEIMMSVTSAILPARRLAEVVAESGVQFEFVASTPARGNVANTIAAETNEGIEQLYGLCEKIRKLPGPYDPAQQDTLTESDLLFSILPDLPDLIKAGKVVVAARANPEPRPNCQGTSFTLDWDKKELTFSVSGGSTLVSFMIPRDVGSDDLWSAVLNTPNRLPFRVRDSIRKTNR